MLNIIYMLFLGLEAGKDSIYDLVEYEPEWAERTIVVLLSELRAYVFLLKEFDDPADIHTRRLNIRLKTYRELLPRLKLEVEDGLKCARDKFGKAKRAANGRAVEYSRRELDLQIWRGAAELLPALESLERELNATVSESRLAQALDW